MKKVTNLDKIFGIPNLLKREKENDMVNFNEQILQSIPLLLIRSLYH